jgi:Polyketide cyclase / dehydrase and lipid transport
LAHAEKSIVVRVPVRAAYRRWTDWEHLPEFLEGVTRVTPRDAQSQEWDVEIAGHAQRWETRVESRDERHVAWRTTGAPHAGGDVELKPVEGGQTLVTLRLSYDPPGEHDTEGAAGMVDRLVMNSLERFRAHAEPGEQRRLADDDAPPPRGAETVTGPEGERGGPLDADAGELPLEEEPQRHHHSMDPAPEGFDSLLERVDGAEPAPPAGADDMGKVFDPDAAGLPERELDANLDDNEAQWSRTNP